MGDRAVITTVPKDDNIDIAKSDQIGVYVHWNGDINHIAAIVTYCKLKNYRPPESDHYGWARLCQVIGNCFGGSVSVGVDICRRLDCNNWDNGTYLIKNWKIVDRKYNPSYSDEKINKEDVLNIMLDIDKCMPIDEQLGEDEIVKQMKKEGYDLDSGTLF